MRFPHPVTVLRAPLVDSGTGQKVRDWDAAAETPRMGNVQTTSSTEVVDGSQVTITEKVLYLQPGADLLTTDRVRIGTDVHEVTGDVEDWTRGGRGNIKARLQLVTPKRNLR